VSGIRNDRGAGQFSLLFFGTVGPTAGRVGLNSREGSTPRQLKPWIYIERSITELQRCKFRY
jgi:hypothetical protein